MGLTKAQLEALNISSFPDNTSELITPEILREYNSASIANTVNQDTYTTDSASFNSRIDSIVTGTGFVTTSSFNDYTSSNDSKVNSLINATASYANSASVAVVNNAQQEQINSLIAFTGSNTNTSLNSYTASNDTKWSNLGSQTGSFITESETGSFATSAITASSLITASISGQTLTFTKGDASTFGVIIPTGSGGSTDITALNAFTASQLVINTGYNTTTSSLLVETQNLELFSASALVSISNLNQSSASQQVSINALNQFTQSAQQEIDSLQAATSSYAISSSVASALNSLSASLTVTDEFLQSQIDALDPSGSAASITLLNEFTASQLTINTGLNTFTQSADGRLDSLESTTASLLIETQNLELFSASALTSISNLNASSASQQSQINSLINATASYANSASVALVDANQQSQINALIAVTGSFLTSSADITQLNAFTASQLTINSGYNTFTQSANQRLNSIESVSGSWITESETASFARTNVDNNFTANQTFTNITAVSASFQYVQTTFETASVIYSSGSNQFGDELSDIQTLSGSVKVQGSLIVNGTPVLTSSVDISGLTTTASFNAYTQSNDEKVNTLISATGSYATTGSNTFIGDQTITGSLLISGSEVIVGELTSSRLRVNSATSLGGTLSVAFDTIMRGDLTIESTTPQIKLRDNGAGGFSSGYDLRVDTGSFEIYDDTHNRNVLSDFFDSASQQHTTSLTSEIIVISGSTSVTLIGNVSASIISASTINGLGNPLSFSSSVASQFASITGSSIDTGSFVNTSSFNSYTSSNDQKVNSLIAATGSYVTTNTNQTITGIKSFETPFQMVATNYIQLGNFATNQIRSSGGRNVTVSATEADGGNSVNITAGNGNSLPNNTITLLTDGSSTTNKITLQSANIIISGSTEVQNFTASLQEGYVWVGNASGRTATVATSSFGGGTTDITALNAFTASQELLNDTFATTGSNTFTGINTFNEEVRIGNTKVLRFDNNGTFSGDSGSRLSADAYTGMQFRNFSNNAMYFEQYGTSSLDFYNYNGTIGITGSATTIQGVNFIPFSASLDARILAITGSGGTIDTGSFATTGSNTFTGDQTLVDAAGNSITISDASGSLMLVAKGFTSASAHISASSAGIGNFIFKTNSNTPDTIISGSGNIFTNAAAATAGFKRYVGGSNNIVNSTSAPQLSGSMQFSPTFTSNYIVGQINMRGPVSSSAYNIVNNNIVGGVNIGSTAANHAQGIVSGLTMNSNNINGSLSIIANKTNTTQQTGISFNQLVQGLTTLNMNSSSIQMQGNILGGTNIITNNTTGSSRVSTLSTNAFYLSQNIIMGGTTITASGSNDPNDTADTDYNANIVRSLIIGNTNAIQLQGGFTGSNSLSATSILGNNLIVTGSSPNAVFNSGLPGTYGSAFVGRFNAVDGNKALSAQTIFAVGTGTSTSQRKTGFLIDSGSNSFFEGTVNVSGSLLVNGTAVGGIDTGSFATTGSNSFNGNQIITGSTTFTGSILFVDRSGNNGNVYLGNDALGMATFAFQPLALGNTISVAIGTNAMKFASGSSQNVAIGNDSLQYTTGSKNVGLGAGTLAFNTTGEQNVAIGQTALNKNISGGNNFAMGSAAMFENTTGNQNVAIGTGALYANTTGNGNVAIGNDAGINASGSSNILIGVSSGKYLTGSANTIIGGFESTAGSSFDNNIILADGVGNARARYSGSVWSFTGGINFESGSNKTTGLVTADATGTTVTNSLVTANSMIFLTPQDLDSGGNIVDRFTVYDKTTGSFKVKTDNGAETTQFSYLIINPTT